MVTNCLSCSLEKIIQNNIPKKNDNTTKNPRERMYLDISSIKHEGLRGRRHWAMLVDEATRCKHSFFLKKKSGQVDMICSLLKILKDKYKIQVKFIHCDMLEKTSNLKKNVMLMDWALSLVNSNWYISTESICGKRFPNDIGKSKSNDELCRVHNKKKKTIIV